ncbi:MAG: ABC transporter permease subunit, partial [Anaerolineae bacterium]|nr:ABC transporter permease subunit [Anaerolineae bacterium]
AGSITLRPIPVSSVLADVVPKSIALLTVSLLFATVIGILLGYLAGKRRNSNVSLVFILVSIIGVSIPSFFAALLLQLLMVRWAKTTGSLPPLPIGGFGWDKHIILPALVLAARPVAQIARVTFVTLGTLLGMDYVRTAQGKGLLPRQIWRGHIWRNALIPILTTIGISLRFSLSSLPVVEYFFGWPGMGFTLLKSISKQDDLLTVALVMVMGLIFIVVNLALDISYRFIDPQLRDSISNIAHEDKRRFVGRIRDGLGSVAGFLRYNEITDFFRQAFRRRSAEPEPSPFADVAAAHNELFDSAADVYRTQRRRAWWRATMGNLPFMVGGFLVLALLSILVFGPSLTPHNPYTTRGLTIIDGEFLVPPFEPGTTYPLGTDVLGRDIASLILSGAQQTLILAVLAVGARLLIGFVLGAIAGWKSGSWIDRLVMGVAEVLSAFPALVLAMIIVLAMGIRQGMGVFVVALCVVGWGETMLYVRGEVMAIRPRPYIESAVAVGVRTTRMMVAHVLPILLAALISLAALEMGAVLMLLGELGFVGIF